MVELHTCLIKSGGGNGPMKPGNLLIQGAKSGGERQMRIRLTHTSNRRCVLFYCFLCFDVKKGFKNTYGKKIVYF